MSEHMRRPMRDEGPSRSVLPMAVMAVVAVAVAAAIAVAVMRPSASNQTGTTTQVATDDTASKDEKDAGATSATDAKKDDASATPGGADSTATDAENAKDQKNGNDAANGEKAGQKANDGGAAATNGTSAPMGNALRDGEAAGNAASGSAQAANADGTATNAEGAATSADGAAPSGSTDSGQVADGGASGQGGSFAGTYTSGDGGSSGSSDSGSSSGSRLKTPLYDQSSGWIESEACATSVWETGSTGTASDINWDDDVPQVGLDKSSYPWAHFGDYVEIEYDGMTITAQVVDCGHYGSGSSGIIINPGVFEEFGQPTSDDWGRRDVSYRFV